STICSGGQLNFTPTADVSGTIFTWTSAVNANITGNTLTGGSGAITNTLVNTGSAIETVTYTITATGPASSSCVNVVTEDYVVTVNPPVQQTITNATPVVCEGVATSIAYSTPTANGTIVVTAVYPAGVTGSVDYNTTPSAPLASGTVTESLSNTNSTPQVVTYTFTANGNGCAANVTTTTVTVNPTPDFTLTPYSSTICSGAQLNFTPTADVSGTIFTWTSAISANITGNSSGSGPITNTLVNTGSAIETVTYTITATGPASSSCVNVVTEDYVVTVNP